MAISRALDPGLQIDLIGQAVSQLLTQLSKSLSNYTQASGGATPATNKAVVATADFTKHLGDLSSGIQNTGLVAGFAFSQLSQLTGAIQSQIGTYVALYSPAAMERFQRAVNDLNASIGEAMLPVFERFRVVVRAVGDSIASLTPSAKAMIAGLAVASVSTVVFTAALAALATVISIASGGTTLALTAAIGGLVAGLGTAAVAASSFGSGMGAFKKVVYQIADVFGGALEALGRGFGQVMTAVQPLLTSLSGVGESFGARLPQLIEQGVGIVMPFIETFASVLAELLPTLSQIGGAILAFNVAVIQIGVAALKPALAMFEALAPIVKLLLFPLVQTMNLLAGLGQALAFVSNIVAAVVSGPFKILSAVFDSIGEAAASFFEPLTDAFSELKAAFSDLFAVFGQVGQLIGPLIRYLGKELGAALKDSGSLLGPVISAFRTVMDSVVLGIQQVTGFLARMARELRAFFGLPAVRQVRPGASDGKAATDVSTSSVEDVIRRAQEAAFRQGRGSPEEETAKNTADIAVAVTNLGKNITDLARDIRGYTDAISNVVGRIASVGEAAVSGINPIGLVVSAYNAITDTRDNLDRTTNVK